MRFVSFDVLDFFEIDFHQKSMSCSVRIYQKFLFCQLRWEELGKDGLIPRD